MAAFQVTSSSFLSDPRTICNASSLQNVDIYQGLQYQAVDKAVLMYDQPSGSLILSTDIVGGATGPTGPAGTSSTTGATGPTGSTGFTGYTGPAGTASATGATGPIGPTGYTGPQGKGGSVGATGYTGYTGFTGFTGPQGYQGPPGVPGVPGPTGAPGIINNIYTNYNTPAGSFLWYCGTTPPANYLICDGRAVGRSTYSLLYQAIGTLYGAGDGSSTFNLPDTRGYFVRSLDRGRGIDPNRALGSSTGDRIMNHSHIYYFGGGQVQQGGFWGGPESGYSTSQKIISAKTDILMSRTGPNGQPDFLPDSTETFPKNIAFIGIISTGNTA